RHTQQHPPRRAQGVERRPERADDAVDQADHPDGEALWIVAGIHAGDALRDDPYFSLRLLLGDAAFQTSLQHVEALLLPRVGTIEPRRQVDVGAKLVETRRHDADERRRHAVQDEAAADRTRIA